ncbi:hypothetical protein, partial [Idiomarina tyrosinivorans]|uniref:hypothetical protein n=1 Tax=Idiomarina tyrosinivorans TaxID=1445662 RepID=UPI001A7E0DFC
AVFSGFVACLKRGAHFRDLTCPVKRFFRDFFAFFVVRWVFRQLLMKATKNTRQMAGVGFLKIPLGINFWCF